MSGGGSSTTQSSTTVPPQFLQAYQNTVNRAQNVANTPYQGYKGPLVAGFSGDQTAAQQDIRNLQNGYNPDLNNASGAIGASTQNLWGGVQQFSPSTIKSYEDPYQSDVINATEGQINNTDAQQQTQLAGNAGSAGAFGGDRMGVAQGILGGQQALANNSTLAGLNQANYSQAVGEFNQQQGAQLGANEANQWLDSQAGYAYGNLANERNQLGLTDASALAQSGLTQQQQQQALYNTAYEQWQAQQAFPYQQTGWLANITEGIGSNVGGTSTTTQTNNAAGGRVPRASGGIVPPGFAVGGTPFDQRIASMDPQAMPWAVNFWNQDTLANPVLEMLGFGSSAPAPAQPVNTHFAGGGIVPPSIRVRPHFDSGGGILSDIPDVAVSYIPGGNGSSGAGGGGIGKGPPSFAQPAPQQPGMFSNPASDIGMATGATSLWNNLGLGSLFGGGTSSAGVDAGGFGAAGVPAEWGTAAAADPWAAASGITSGAGGGAALMPAGTWAAQGAAAAADIADPWAAATGADLAGAGSAAAGSGAAAAGAGAGGAGFLGSLGSAVEAGAADVGSGIAAGAGALGDAAVAGASAIGDGLAAAGTWLLGLLALKHGGAVEPNEAQHKAGGGIVVPFPSHLARGGIATGNAGEMPYEMAPPVPVQMTGTNGPMSYMPGSGQGGQGGAPSAAGAPFISNAGMPMQSNPFGVSGTPNLNLKRGGIVVPFRKHFDDGGAATADPDTDWGGAGTSAPTPAGGITTAATPAAAPTQDAAASYTPTKPNAWMPVLAALATAGLGRHHEAGHNIAEGVLAGLSTYGQEDTRYQGEQEKAATIQNEAKQLADNAAWHKEQMQVENDRNTMEGQHYTAQEAIDRQRATSEAGYQQGELGVRNKEADTQAASEQSMADWRRSLEGGIGTPIGTTTDGRLVYSNPKFGKTPMTEDGEPYTGQVGPMPKDIAHNQVVTNGQNQAHADHQATLDQAWALRADTINQNDREGIRKQADTFYTGAAAAGKPITGDQAMDMAIAQHGKLTGMSPLVPAKGPDPLLQNVQPNKPMVQSAPAQSAAPAIPTLTDPSQIGKLTPGTKFYDPNGVLRQVPLPAQSP